MEKPNISDVVSMVTKEDLERHQYETKEKLRRLEEIKDEASKLLEEAKMIVGVDQFPSVLELIETMKIIEATKNLADLGEK